MTQYNIIPVILCGGSGTRLWPASRALRPKQFLDLLDTQRSLLQETAKRATRITKAPFSNLVTVTGETLHEQVKEQLLEISNEATQHVLKEPHARNTAAAIAYASTYIKEQFGENAIMWVLPADHHMGDEAALEKAFLSAMEAAKQDHLVTMGITPCRPETGYGYIQAGHSLINDDIFLLKEFKEKPDQNTAKAYIEKGYLWNSGMFLFKTKTVLAEFELHASKILNGVKKAMKNEQVDSVLYASIPSVPFDVAIMEKSDRGAVIPCDPKWSDIGSWESLWELREKDDDGNITHGSVITHETKNCFVQSKDRVIACAGLENIVIVDTGDALLIADYRKSEQIKALVEKIKERSPEFL